jgi:flagellar basal body rod protein FlgF
MKIGFKFAVAVIAILITAAIVAQSQCYESQAARKNALHNDSTTGKSTEQLKQRIRDLQNENEKNPAPVNPPVAP